MTGSLIAEFMLARALCAIGVAALLGVVMVFGEVSQRFAERQRALEALRTIARALHLAESFDGDCDLSLLLPASDPFRLAVRGELHGGIQHIRMRAGTAVYAELETRLAVQVNSGNFSFAVDNPGIVRISKRPTGILLEVS
jgi:hypothetical protein